jgi:hypothetical protein
VDTINATFLPVASASRRLSPWNGHCSLRVHIGVIPRWSATVGVSVTGRA